VASYIDNIIVEIKKEEKYDKIMKEIVRRLKKLIYQIDVSEKLGR